jgi:hypothetical protein
MVKQHVDDITIILWSINQAKLGVISTTAATEWYAAMCRLQLTVSSKTKLIPQCEAALVVQAALKDAGIEVGIADHHVDLGVDTAVGNKCTVKYKKRAHGAYGRSRRSGFLVSKYKRAKIVATGGCVPAYVYGGSAIGVSPDIIKLHKQNLNAALGGCRKKGASATVNIQWRCGTKAQPYVQSHTSHVKALFRYLDKHRK